MPKVSTAAKLLFSEDFNSLKLRYPSTGTGVWNTEYDWGSDTIINHEQQYYVDVANDGTSRSGGQNPFSVSNGILTITANHAPEGTSNGQPFTSGVITTQHSFSTTYGYMEMRAQLPAGAGTWPAFWMDRVDLKWPPELDIMEEIGQQPNTLVGTVHSNQTGKHTFNQHYLKTPDLSKGFHTYGADWQKDKIVWYFDGKAFGQSPTPADLHSPMYMMANLAIGGDWPGPAPDQGQFPAQYKIDYIRVWDHKPASGTTNSGTQPGTTPAPGGTAGTNDTITLRVSEDAYKGHAVLRLLVDGKQIGADTAVTASHEAGLSQEITFHTDLLPTTKAIKVRFQNDAWDGDAAHDRNLYIDSATINGHTLLPDDQTLMRTGDTATFNVAHHPEVLTSVGLAGLVGSEVW